MARRRRTLEETSALNAQRFNEQQRERLPLFMQAGLEEDLLARGVLRDRPADHLARVHTAYVARLGRGDPAVWDRSARLQRAFKVHCPEVYAAELLRWRGLRARFASLRRAADNADWWLSLLRRHLSREAFLAVLDVEWPTHAATLRHVWAVDERLARKAALGAYNSWLES